MQFEWVIPLVVVIVWLLNKLLRGQEDDDVVKPNKGAATRSPSSDIDRFLSEIDRLRKQSAVPKPAEPPMVRPVERTRPIERARPVVRPQGERRPPQEPIIVMPTTPAAEPALTELPELATVRVRAIPQLSPRRGSDAAVAVAAMLKSPKSVKTAFALQEVLGKPKGRR